MNRGVKLEQGEDGLLASETRKKIVQSIIGRLSSEVWHKSKQLTLQEVIQEQAYNVKNHLLKKIHYHPFLGQW